MSADLFPERWEYRRAGLEPPVLDDQAHAKAVESAEGRMATQLDVTLEAHYPDITPEGIEALTGEEWDKVCAVAKVASSEKVRARVRARVAGWRRQLAERAANETVEDLFAPFANADGTRS